MGFTLEPPPHDSIPASLRPWFEQFIRWCKERERFEKLIGGKDTSSASSRLSRRRGIIVDSSRVASSTSGTATVDLTGDLIPSADAAYDIGSTAKRYRNEYLSGTAVAAGVQAVGLTVSDRAVLAGVSTTSGISTIWLSASSGVTVSGKADLLGGAGIVGLSVISGATFNTSVVPLNTIQWDLGSAARRWAFVWGATAGFNQTLTVGGTFTQSGFAQHNSLAGDVSMGSKCAVDGALGVTGLATFVSGVTTSGVTTTDLLATGLGTFLSGITADGLTVTHVTVTGGMSFSGASILAPVTTVTGSVGLANKRWANIFGATASLTNSFTVGGTLTVSGTGVHTIHGTINNNASGETFNANDITVAGAFNPVSDGFGSIGNGGPEYATDVRWSSVYLAGLLGTHKGAGISAGTELYPGLGNYFSVTGVSTITGISAVFGITDYQAGIFHCYHTVNNPTWTHSSKLILKGATDFAGSTDNVITFVSEGLGNWREVSRSA